MSLILLGSKIGLGARREVVFLETVVFWVEFWIAFWILDVTLLYLVLLFADHTWRRVLTRFNLDFALCVFAFRKVRLTQ